METRSENNYTCNNLLNRVEYLLNCSAVTKQENAAECDSHLELINFFAFIIWRIITLMPSNVSEKYFYNTSITVLVLSECIAFSLS